MDIVIPTGISIGENKFLEIASARRIIITLIIADITTKIFMICPTNFLAIWGDISPKNQHFLKGCCCP